MYEIIKHFLCISCIRLSSAFCVLDLTKTLIPIILKGRLQKEIKGEDLHGYI